MEKNGEKWRKMEGNGKIVVIAQGMWVVEGCGGMRLRKMGEIWEKNGRKMGRNTHFSQSQFPHFPGGRRSSPQFPHRAHQRKNRSFCHSPTLTATAASADAWPTHQIPPPSTSRRVTHHTTSHHSAPSPHTASPSAPDQAMRQATFPTTRTQRGTPSQIQGLLPLHAAVL